MSSDSPLMTGEEILSQPTMDESQTNWFPKLNVSSLLDWFKHREVQIGFLLVGLLMAVFWQLISATLGFWSNMDGYYQHGPLVPFGIAYILYANRDRIQKYPPKPTWAPMPLFVALLVLGVIAAWAYFFVLVQSALFIAALCTLAWMIYGFRRALAMSPALFFASVGLPMWNRLIDDHTNQLQIWSTDGAYAILKVIGLNPFRDNPTTIHLDNFVLEIAAACSGMKLTLALLASTVFILLIARLKWWGNLVLIAVGLPLAVAINSLRIAIIGIFGDQVSSEAGYLFHDYGSYLTLILAFWLLYVLSKKLGWKV